ncbi:helix-turn-helix domain-containing protein [Nibribacter ruber]|uniref:Helix-turn-helix domain-containing protein n=1 Tax=Nibribacter ruber TaxID=2698458 RepID=A0A6P1NZ88_9BACT|nr:helix-turn-helix domain-containing protein [Nibribacter ruber]QHL88350.1 helix-turn-helix domain-containing protein [Nibribacter ruber]
MGVTITKFAPAETLQDVVNHYWVGSCTETGRAEHQKVFPSGFLEVVLPLSAGEKDASVTGQVGFWTVSHALPAPESREWFGICFHPEALPGLFGLSTSGFLNCASCQTELDASFSAFCQQICQASTHPERVSMADKYLQSLRQAGPSQARPSYVEAAAKLIRLQKCHVSVEGLSQNLCIGVRQLERAFKKNLGLSPKTYMRLSRLSSVLQLLSQNPNLPLAQLSYLGGYSDQAHFNREFKQMTGIVPTKYLAQPQEFLTF